MSTKTTHELAYDLLMLPAVPLGVEHWTDDYISVKMERDGKSALLCRTFIEESRKQTKCSECGETTCPSFTVIGPRWADGNGCGGPMRHFCCVRHFWDWVDRVIKDRDKGGILTRQHSWD